MAPRWWSNVPTPRKPDARARRDATTRRSAADAKGAPGRPARRAAGRRAAGPGVVIWTVALIGLVLPVVAAAAGLFGAWRIWRGEPLGAELLAVGAAALVLDIVIDLWLQRLPAVSGTGDSRALNTRAARHIGQTAILDTAIAGGRGRVRLADTCWAVSGPDLPAGSRVRIVAAKGTVLEVRPAEPAD